MLIGTKQFLNNGLTVFPQLSHVQNSGFDGSGLHCGVNNDFDTKLNNIKTKTLPKKINESKLYRFNAYLFYKNTFLEDILIIIRKI